MASSFEVFYGRNKRIKEVIIRLSGTASGSEEDTGYDLPSSAVLLLPPWINVTTAEATGATKTLDVGILSSESGGDADGFLDGVSVASTGVVQAAPVVTVGGTETFYAAAQTIGALFRSGFIAGTNLDQDYGLLATKPFLSNSITGKSVSVTSGSAFTEFKGTLHFLMLDLTA
jgi:hypothetical protein